MSRFQNLQNMLVEVEELLPNASEVQRRPFLALHTLFNRLATPEMTVPNPEKVLGTYQSKLDSPSVEVMIMHLLLGTMPNWQLQPFWMYQGTFAYG